MISDNRIRTLARQTGVTAGLAEKNYVNSWILYAVYEASDLNDSLVFKGGTALSKLYFPQVWRFSEDLDFTATQKVENLEQRLKSALTEAETISGIQFEISNFYEAGDPVEFIRIDVQYDAALRQRNTTQIEITFNESLAFPVVTHTHGFEDIPEFTVRAYSIEEIFVEKLRSLFQRARARDYYDIYRLQSQEEFNTEKISQALQEKARQQNVNLDLENGIPQEDIEDVRNYWNQALDRLVTDKPRFEDVIGEIEQYLQELRQHRV